MLDRSFYLTQNSLLNTATLKDDDSDPITFANSLTFTAQTYYLLFARGFADKAETNGEGKSKTRGRP